MSRVGSLNPNFSHGGTHTRLYRIWIGMKGRCSTESAGGFNLYGGRGIDVCEDWRSNFPLFRSWAFANGYAADLEIDRKNNGGPYAPWNCRWVTKKINCRNTRRNVVVAAFGEDKTIAEWAEDQRSAVSHGTLRSRLRRGVTPELAISSKKIVANQFIRRFA